MKTAPEDRALMIGRYIVRSGSTVRATAVTFGVSKSTVWKDHLRLKQLHPALWNEVRRVMDKNKSERHLRGGEATRRRYLNIACRPPGIPRKNC